MQHSAKQFRVFFDPYYWRTAVLIAKSNLVRQYRGSYLGMVWTLLQPMTMLLVYASVMPLLTRLPARDYSLYIICTLPLWGFIANTLVGASSSLLGQGETLKRCMISSSLFPVADVLRHVYIYAIAFSVMCLGALLFGLPIDWHALLVPLYFIPVLITVMALAIGIAYVAPYIRDIGEVVMVGMNVMMWFSAVPYPVEAMPEDYRGLMLWNPFYNLMHPVITLVYGRAIPDIESVLRLLIIMGISIALSFVLYRVFRRNFVYYL